MQISKYYGKLNGGLLALLVVHAVICCVSMTLVVGLYGYLHLFGLVQPAIIRATFLVLPLIALSAVFAFSHFSFGYLAGFYLYTVVLGYLWLIPFSRLDFDHTVAGLSALASLAAFLAPNLLINWPAKPQISLSQKTLNWLLIAIMAIAVTTIAAGMYYNFKLISLDEIYQFRDRLDFPSPLRYAIGITLGALLPFAFACFVEMRARILAVAVLFLFLCFYPITLTKTTLFAPLWLAFLWLLASYLQARVAVILSLLAPMLVGVMLAQLFNFSTISQAHLIDYFGYVNFRMIAFPSIALDVYNDFFSRHDVTRFCQISLIGSGIGCPYTEQLSLILGRNYPVGNINASLLATEGIASLGTALAPFGVVLSGLIISTGSYTSAKLPARFVILSSGILIQTLLNVPLSTLMVTNGAVVIFLLWYIVPCTLFATRNSEP